MTAKTTPIRIRNGDREYLVGKQVAGNPSYQLYTCSQEGLSTGYLLQIAKDTAANPAIDRMMYILRLLKKRSDELEEEYSKVKKDPKDCLNYDFGFSHIIDSFLSLDQGGRKVNILSFRNISDVTQLVPLSNVRKSGLRIDLRTSVWLMGKYLKLLTLVHDQNIAIRYITDTNLLMERDLHYVMVFDWTRAQIFQNVITSDDRIHDISQAARAIIHALGGDWITGSIPDVEDDIFLSYTDYLLRLARGGESKALRAHGTFYEIADTIWKREFYPFTVKPL